MPAAASMRRGGESGCNLPRAHTGWPEMAMMSPAPTSSAGHVLSLVFSLAPVPLMGTAWCSKSTKTWYIGWMLVALSEKGKRTVSSAVRDTHPIPLWRADGEGYHRDRKPCLTDPHGDLDFRFFSVPHLPDDDSQPAYDGEPETFESSGGCMVRGCCGEISPGLCAHQALGLPPTACGR